MAVLSSQVFGAGGAAKKQVAVMGSRTVTAILFWSVTGSPHDTPPHIARMHTPFPQSAIHHCPDLSRQITRALPRNPTHDMALLRGEDLGLRPNEKLR